MTRGRPPVGGWLGLAAGSRGGAEKGRRDTRRESELSVAGDTAPDMRNAAPKSGPRTAQPRAAVAEPALVIVPRGYPCWWTEYIEGPGQARTVSPGSNSTIYRHFWGSHSKLAVAGLAGAPTGPEGDRIGMGMPAVAVPVEPGPSPNANLCGQFITL